MKIQAEVKKQTIRVGVGTALLALVMVLVFVALKQFSSGVVLGAILGTAAATLDFFLLGLAVQKTAEETYRNAPPEKQETEDEPADEPLPTEDKAAAAENEVEKSTRQRFQLIHTGRMLLIGAVAVIGWVVPGLNGWATILPILLRQVVIAGIGMLNQK